MMYSPGCRACFAEGGFNSKLIKDEISGEYRCKTNPNHRYVEDKESGMLILVK